MVSQKIGMEKYFAILHILTYQNGLKSAILKYYEMQILSIFSYQLEQILDTFMIFFIKKNE